MSIGCCVNRVILDATTDSRRRVRYLAVKTAVTRLFRSTADLHGAVMVTKSHRFPAMDLHNKVLLTYCARFGCCSMCCKCFCKDHRGC